MKFNNWTKLMNRTLKIVVPKIDPPYLNRLNFSRKEDGIGYGPGIAWEFLREMAERLNLTYDVESVETEGWGKRSPDGTWNGALRHLIDGNAEILAGGTILTPDRYEIIDFTKTIGYESSGILIRIPERKDFVAKMLLGTFTWDAWLSLLFTFLLAIWTFIFIQIKIGRFGKGQHFSIADTFWMFAVLFLGAHPPTRSLASRTLVATLLFGSIFLIAHAAANLVSSFAHGTSNYPFDSLEELIQLVKIGKWKLVLDNKSTGRIKMIEVFAADPEFCKIMTNPEHVIYVEDLSEGIRTVQMYPGDLAFIAPRARLKIVSAIECNVTVLPTIVLPSYMSIALRKGSPYKHYLNKKIMKYWENGLILRWMKNFWGTLANRHRQNTTKCGENDEDRLKKGIFGLIHLQRIFTLFSIGIILSIFVFIAEVIAGKMFTIFI